MTALSVRPTASYVVIFSREKWESMFGHLADKILQYEGEGLYNKKTGEYLSTQRPELCKPYVIPDIPAHVGPSGKVVNSRSDQRDEFKRSDTYPWEPINDRPRGFTDSRVVRQRGLKAPCEATKEWLAKEKKKAPPKRRIGTQERQQIEKAQKETLHKLGITS